MRFWKGASIVSKSDPSITMEAESLVTSSVVAAVHNDTADPVPGQKIRYRSGHLVVDSFNKALGTNNDQVLASDQDMVEGNPAYTWKLGKIPGKILSPFLVHSTFTKRLHMVNYSDYG